MSRQGDYFDANMGVLWVQPDGPNTQPQYLGCHDLGDVSEPQGDIAQRYCPNPDGPGSWDVVLVTQGPPDRITTTVTTYVGKTADWLEKQICPIPVYVHQSMCGKKNIFLSYDRGELYQYARFASKGRTNLVMREGVDASEQTFDLSADSYSNGLFGKYYPLKLTPQVTTEANTLYDIAFCNALTCLGPCGPAKGICTDGYIVAAAGAGVSANVLRTIDAGTTWAATAADPFAIDEDIISVVCFPISRTITRVVVGRGTTDVANPAEIAYSDDNGATWTNVNVGSTNGEYMQWTGALFAIDNYNIWAITDLGNIFKSTNGAVSWTEQTTTNVNGLNYIRFKDENHGLTVGDTNTILYTEDGGAHWVTITGPAAQAAQDALCCEILDAYRWWVGYADGELWYTNDGGTNWFQRAFTAPAGAATVDRVNDVMFLDDFLGFFVIKWTDGLADEYGTIYRTFNGGHDWEVYQVDTAFDSGTPIGLNSVWACHYNLAYSVGDPIDSTGAIYTVST